MLLLNNDISHLSYKHWYYKHLRVKIYELFYFNLYGNRALILNKKYSFQHPEIKLIQVLLFNRLKAISIFWA